jgi:hypothetical protein
MVIKKETIAMKDYSDTIKFVSKHYIEITLFYIFVPLICAIWAAYHKSNKYEKYISEKKYKKIINYVLVPLLLPNMIAMWGLLWFVFVIIIFSIIENPSREFIIYVFILWFIVSLISGIKSYNAIINKNNGNNNGGNLTKR